MLRFGDSLMPIGKVDIDGQIVEVGRQERNRNGNCRPQVWPHFKVKYPPVPLNSILALEFHVFLFLSLFVFFSSLRPPLRSRLSKLINYGCRYDRGSSLTNINR